MDKTVALQKCNEYEFDIVFSSILKLFELVPPPDVKNKTVLIKPNILYPKKPEMAVCTHPVVVGAVVKAFVEKGAKKVFVGESPAIANSTSAAKATGIFNQVIQNGGEWVDFHQHKIKDCPQGKIVKQFNFASQFFEADIVVSLAKLKSHQLMSYTGAMKNLFGMIIGLEKAQTHYQFPKKEDFGTFLTDINIAANAQYAIMDAIVGMEGPGGPGGGDPIKLGFLASSKNILALDWTCASLVGYNPHKIVNLEDALTRKIWLNSPDEIQIIGEKFDDVKNTSFKIVQEPSTTLQKMVPNWLNFFAKKIFIRTPYIKSSKCKKCGRCTQICPPQIIKLQGKNGTAILSDKSKCIHCFCCHEICAYKAIKLKHF